MWKRQKVQVLLLLGEHVRSGFNDRSKPAGETDIGDLVLEKGCAFKDLFDYGDKIVHSIRVVDIYENKVPAARFPRLTESAGEVPPQYEGNT